MELDVLFAFWRLLTNKLKNVLHWYYWIIARRCVKQGKAISRCNAESCNNLYHKAAERIFCFKEVCIRNLFSRQVYISYYFLFCSIPVCWKWRRHEQPHAASHQNNKKTAFVVTAISIKMLAHITLIWNNIAVAEIMETELLLTSSRLIIRNVPLLFRLAALIQAEIVVAKSDVMRKLKKKWVLLWW